MKTSVSLFFYYFFLGYIGDTLSMLRRKTMFWIKYPKYQSDSLRNNFIPQKKCFAQKRKKVLVYDMSV